MKRILLYLSFFLSYYGYAKVVGQVKVQGEIKYFDKHTVTLKQQNNEFKVPRESIKNKDRLRTGKTVHALLSIEDLNRLSVKKIEVKKQRRIASQRDEKWDIETTRTPASSEY